MGDSQGYLPMGGGMGGAGKGTVDKFGNMAGQPKNAVTSALKGSTGVGKTAGTTAAGTTSKLPGLTSKATDATGKTITSTGTGAGKVSGVKNTGTAGTKTSGSSGSTLGKTITSALTGAALGAGTKFVIDKLTGKKVAVDSTGKVVDKNASSGTGIKGNASTIGSNIGKSIVDSGVKKITDKVTGADRNVSSGAGKITSVDKNASSGTGIKNTNNLATKTSGTGLKGNSSSLGSNIGKTITSKVVNDVGSKIAGTVTKKITDGGTKTGATKTVTPKTGGSKTTTPAKAGVTAKTAADIKAENPELTDEEVEAELDRIRDAEESLGVPEGAEDNGDGTYSVTEDGMVTTYDANGNILGMEAAVDGNFGEDTGGNGSNNAEVVSTVENADGTVTVKYADGSTRTIDEDFNIGDKEPSDGTTTETIDDGSVVTYDANGNFLYVTGPSGNRYDADGELIDGSDTLVNDDEEVSDGGFSTDDEGNLYDSNGNIYQYADGTYAGDEDTAESEEGFFTDDDGNLYDSSGNLYQYADGSFAGDEETVASDDGFFTDDDGNLYDSNGEIYQYADGTFAGDESFDENAVAYTDEDGNTYDYNGDLIAEGDSGSDDEYTSEDEYSSDDEYSYEDNYAYEDDYSYYDDMDFGKKGGLFKMAEGGSLDEPIDEKQNADGTITQMFDDGSSITYNEDGEVVKVAEAKKFDEGGVNYSDTDEEVQDFQNVDYNFGEYDDPTMTGYTLTGNRNPVGNTYMRSSPVGLSELVEGDSSSLSNVANVDLTGDESYMPEGAIDNEDGTFTIDNEVFDMQTGNFLYLMNDAGEIVYVDPSAQSVSANNQDESYMPEGAVDNNDGTYTLNGLTYDMQTGMPLYRENENGGLDVARDNGDGTYTIGNTTYDMASDEPLYEERGGTAYDLEGNPLWSTDSAGNIIAPTVTSAGSTGATNITNRNPVDPNVGANTKSAIDSLLAGLNTYGGAGAAGAVLGALLSDSDLFSGGGGGGSNFDMTGVGAINPRTTDFGIGPANYVGYDQYGTPEAMPELYGRELYQNLNAPGFNEVNPGDYARYDEEEFGSDDMYLEEPMDEVQPMAEGGMPQGGLGQTAPQTYYTFGKTVDPLQNLRNPTPFQQQPQQPQMPPQAAQNAQQMPPQQALPQMGMAPTQPSIPQGVPPAGIGMKGGGLPALSNVPITQGRLNFRKGAPVHGPGDGQSDDIPAMLADGEYVIDAETVAQIGNGSTKAGAQALDKFRENIRRHKRSAPVNKIPPKTKALTSYLKGAR
jgi:hypothetical protein